LGAVTAVAQERFGALYGTVMDPSQAAMPNATVTVSNKETGRTFTVQTGSDGAYVIRELEPGRYSLKVEAKGFRTHEVPDIYP
jgi:hypothetical protein